MCAPDCEIYAIQIETHQGDFKIPTAKVKQNHKNGSQMGVTQIYKSLIKSFPWNQIDQNWCSTRISFTSFHNRVHFLSRNTTLEWNEEPIKSSGTCDFLRQHSGLSSCRQSSPFRLRGKKKRTIFISFIYIMTAQRKSY